MDPPVANDYLRTLTDALHGITTADVIPPGWLRSIEVAAQIRRSHSHTMGLLKKWVEEDGTWERQTFRAPTGRRLLPTPFYRERG